MAQLKMSVKSLKDIVTLCDASEQSLKNELAAASMESTGLVLLFDSRREKTDSTREKWAAGDAIDRSIFKDSYLTPCPFIRGLVGNFRVDLIILVS